MPKEKNSLSTLYPPSDEYLECELFDKDINELVYSYSGFRKYITYLKRHKKVIVVAALAAMVGTGAVTAIEKQATNNARKMEIAMGCTGRELMPVTPGESYAQVRSDARSLLPNGASDTQLDFAISTRNPNLIWNYTTSNQAVVPNGVYSVAVPDSCPSN